MYPLLPLSPALPTRGRGPEERIPIDENLGFCDRREPDLRCERGVAGDGSAPLADAAERDDRAAVDKLLATAPRSMPRRPMG